MKSAPLLTVSNRLRPCFRNSSTQTIRQMTASPSFFCFPLYPRPLLPPPKIINWIRSSSSSSPPIRPSRLANSPSCSRTHRIGSERKRLLPRAGLIGNVDLRKHSQTKRGMGARGSRRECSRESLAEVVANRDRLTVRPFGRKAANRHDDDDLCDPPECLAPSSYADRIVISNSKVINNCIISTSPKRTFRLFGE